MWTVLFFILWGAIRPSKSLIDGRAYTTEKRESSDPCFHGVSSLRQESGEEPLLLSSAGVRLDLLRVGGLKAH
jgi:hypothetical protein